jgi:hypothetical protein
MAIGESPWNPDFLEGRDVKAYVDVDSLVLIFADGVERRLGIVGFPPSRE